MKELVKKIDTSKFNIFTSPAIELDRKVYDPNFTEGEKKQLRTIFRLLLNEYFIDFFQWEPQQKLRAAISKIPHRIFADRRLPLQTYVGKYYIPLMKKAAGFEYLVQQTDIRKLPDISVGELLKFEVPINRHPVFHGSEDESDTRPDPELNDTQEPGRPADDNTTDRPRPPKPPVANTPRSNELNVYIAGLAALKGKEKDIFIEKHNGQLLDTQNAKKLFGKDISQTQLKKINYVKGLLELTDYNKTLSTQLFTMRGMTSLKDLAANKNIDWKSLVKKGVASKKNGGQLEQTLANAYPTAYITARVKKTSPLLVKFLDANPQLNILTAKMDSNGKDSYNWDQIAAEDRKQLVKEVQGYQRLHFLTEDIRQIPTLMNAGFRSSQDIIKRKKEDFIAISGLPEKEARIIYKNAQNINNEALTALSLHIERQRDVAVPFINTQNDKADDDIDYQEIFGSLNFCDCEHCNSVLSPAAYFVDLLNFIKTNNGNALRELKRRRPDLWNIQLNCDQTNSTQPYLKLIMEVLGDYMVREASVMPNAPDSLEDILYLPWVNPELPFEEDLLKARLLAEGLDTSLFEIYRDMEVNPAVQMAEYLGIGPESLKWILSGQPLPDVSAQLHDAQSFANLFNLSYDELKELSESELGNKLELQAVKLDIQSYKEQVKVNHGSPQQRAAYLKKIFSFLRIYRHLDYSIDELDYYLSLAKVGNKDYTAAHLANLSALIFVKNSYDLSDEQLRILVNGYANDDFSLEASLNEDDHLSLARVLLLLGVGQEDFGKLVAAFEADLGFDGDKLKLDTTNLSLLKHNIFWASAAELSISDWLEFVDFYRIKPAVLKNNWQLLLAMIQQHEKTGIPVALSAFYTKGIENDEWYYRVGELSLANWLADLQSNETRFETLDGWCLSVANLLGDDDQVIRVLFGQLLDTAFPNQGESTFLERVNSLIENDVDVSDPQFKAVLSFFQLLDKNLQVLSFLKFSGDSLDFFFSNTSELGINPKNPKELLIAIYHFSKWMEGLSEDLSLAELLLAGGLDAGGISDEEKSLVESYFGHETRVVEDLLEFFGGGNPAKLSAWNTFFNAVNLCSSYDLTPGQLKIITDVDAISNTPRQYYRQLISFFEQSLELSSFSDEKKQEISDEVNDRVLEQKRDALLALLKKSIKVDFSDTSKIYEYFLLDVETSACSDVSPIKAGILSLQLFVQRCMMNLEEDENGNKLQFYEDDKKEWEWRKNYRVWEVNRKIFLYPENYTDPNLRDDKTPIYEELEGDIQQRDLSLSGIENTYRRYLKEFSVVAQLAITGSFYDPGTKLYYYFGRTASVPYQYHYRSYKKSTRAWSPWYAIDVKVESDYITGIIANGRFYIFWKTTEKYMVTDVKDGNATTDNKFKHFINYAYMQEDSSWSKPIKIDANIDARIDTLDYIDIDADASEEEIAAYIHLNNVWALMNLNFELADEGDFSSDDFKHDSYIYVEKATTRANCFRVRISDTIGRDPDTDHTSETDVYINFYEDRFVEKRNLGSNSGSDFLVVSTKAGIEGAHPNYQNPEHEWNYTEHYRMNLRSGMDYDFKWESMSDDGQYITTGNNQDLSVINGNHTTNYIVKNNEKYYQFLFFNGGLYALNSYVVNDLSENLFINGIDDFLTPESQLENTEHSSLILGDHPFAPREIFMPENGLDFNGPNGIYFKELYFHIPFTLARHFNQHQRYEEADYWYKKLFDPTVEYGDEEKYWQYTPFRKNPAEKFSDILQDNESLNKYHSDPFNPHAIARLRLSSYPKAVVMSYIDNLLDWGDSLFRKDTYESINEAMMLYITAQQLLGSKPRSVTSCNTANQSRTFATIEDGLDSNSDILIEIESYIGNKKLRFEEHSKKLEAPLFENNVVNFRDDFAGDIKKHVPDTKPGYNDATMLKSITEELFCIPWNDMLLQYWETVEDRMFKIRNCLNIDGEYRQLALFEPPIDPMLLVKARAAGINLSQLTSQEKMLPYRFTYLQEKARSYVQMVQGFGQTLLSTLEKEDGEALNELRTIHEGNILRMISLNKEKQIEELEYRRLNLEIEKEKLSYAIEHFQQLLAAHGISAYGLVDKLFKKSSTILKGTQIINLLTSALYLIPQVGAPTAMTFGGKNTGDSSKEAKEASRTLADYIKMGADIAEKYQNHTIKNMGWEKDLNSSRKELEITENQLLVNELKMAVAERDLEVHEKNMEQNQEILDFYAEKMTSEALYNLLSGHLTRLFRDAYGLAFQTALDAQAAYRFETNEAGASFVAFDNWDTAAMGLLSAEKLQYQLMQMESAFHEKNVRKAEVRTSVSLSLLDPQALLSLKAEGLCDFTIPEAWFDIQYPGQYKRRIKALALTIPCVVGPHVNVACTLKLQNSYLRTVPDMDEALIAAQKTPDGNDRIFTSHAQNDTGVLDFSFRDERYLPFEGAGVHSEWQLKLPKNVRSFNYNTIGDVIVHISYTAEYDESFGQLVEDRIFQDLNSINQENGLFRVLSLKREFANEWYQAASEGAPMEISLESEHFPFFAQGGDIQISSVWVKEVDMANDEVKELPGVVGAASGSIPLGLSISLAEEDFAKELYLLVNYSV